MQRVFRLVDTSDLEPVGVKSTAGFDRSVERHGVITPILVAEVVDDDGVIEMVIVDGNRRVRAAKAAGMEKIPAVVLKETTAQDRDRLTLMANQLRSDNFHTESRAITALARDEESAGRVAHGLGISTVKLQNMFRKLRDMPDEVRVAMNAGRIPVSSAMSIAGWPEELQDRIVAHLRTRRGMDTRTVDAIRKEYERQHPSPRRPRSSPEPVDAWMEEDMATFTAPPPSAPPPAVQPPTPGSGAADQAPATPQPAEPEDPRAFIARLDAVLLAQARETQARNLPRSVWIDRAMRAWDIAEEGERQ